MEYVLVGDNRISRMTLGTAQLGLNYGIANVTGKPALRSSFEILEGAVHSGITCIDTAPVYGDSEGVIGAFLTRQPCSPDCTVVTKLPALDLTRGTTFAEVHHVVRKHVTSSIHKLRSKRLPIYLLHRASDLDSYGGMVIESLLRLKDEGLIGVLGVSVYTPEEVEHALELEAIKAIQVPVNIFDHRLIKTGLVEQLRDKNFIVFARSIFLQGLFFLDAKNLPPSLALAENPLRQLQELSHHRGLGIAQLALTFVRDLPGITSLVIGAETRNQVLQDIDLMKSAPLSSELREEIMSLFSNVPLEVINPTSWNPNKQQTLLS